MPCVQGEVEQVSMMKPIAQGPHDTGLLEYLEDIIGTDKYKPQLEESSKRCGLLFAEETSHSHICMQGWPHNRA